jgi:xanthine dehydrogenase YagS FAD-binding subunit
MRPFAYYRALDERDACEIAAARPGAAYIAGGTDLMQLWKAGARTPELVIDISRLPLDQVGIRHGTLRIGALARMRDVAEHPLIRSQFPVIREALLASASPQVRNVATIGGNLLQRTRCSYFRGSALPCNKRRPGSGCGAFEGVNRVHAIFGTSAHCAAPHASDLAVALVALDARIRLRSKAGERTLSIEDFFLVPGAQPERETLLADGELVIDIEVPSRALARRSRFLKLRDRAAFEFALVSLAVGLEVRDRFIRDVRIAAGGLATKPWRLRACEAELAGALVCAATFRKVAERAVDGAQPLSDNGYKVDLLRRIVLRALQEVGDET